MSLPALRALTQHFPEENIYLISKHYLYDVYQHLEGIKAIITIPDTVDFKNILKIAKQLRKYRFDSGLLFTNSFNSALLFKLSGIKELMGYSKELRGFLLDKRKKFPRDSDKHHIYFYMDLAALFLKEKTGKEINKKYSDQLVIPPGEKENLRSLLTRFGIGLANGLIGISPSAAYGTAKQWLPERFRELIIRIRKEMPDCDVLLLGSGKEKEKIAKIIDNIGDANDKIHSLAGRLSLGQAIAAISLCDVFVSNDSGLMHVASSLRVPLAAIFGPTQPHKTGPLKEYNEKVKILHHPVQCAPCKNRDCPIDHHPCMKAVTVDEVFQAIVELKNE
jgi:heptosyltransferase-2